MKGYGLPRNNQIENPDLADISEYGLKGKRKRNKDSARRIWKKKVRKAIKDEIKKEVDNLIGF